MANRKIDPSNDSEEYFNFVALLNAVAQAAMPEGKTFSIPFLFNYEDEVQAVDSGTDGLGQADIFDDDDCQDES